jgi:dUTP pyrophosphatase
MKLLVKKFHKDAKLPFKKRDSDEGYDIFSIKDEIIHSGETISIPSGIGIMVEDNNNYWLQIEGRSSMALKGVFPIGGIIDVGYTGECKVILSNNSSKDYAIKKGDKIAQVIIRKHYHAEIIEVEEFKESDRGDKGFGSSGK